MIICSGFSIKKCKCCVQAGSLTLIFGILSLFISVDSGTVAWGLKYSIVNNYIILGLFYTCTVQLSFSLCQSEFILDLYAILTYDFVIPFRYMIIFRGKPEGDGVGEGAIFYFDLKGFSFFFGDICIIPLCRYGNTMDEC